MHDTKFMNLTRVVVLGLLAEQGAQHGYQLRRDVELTRVGEWGGVGTGSLHRELRALERDGLVEETQTERVGRRPERTVYQITDAGRTELAVLRSQTLGRFVPPTDPVAVGLVFAAASADQATVASLLAQHRVAVEAEISRLDAEHERGLADGHLDPANSRSQAAAFRRAELHAQAELRWHEDCDRLFSGRARQQPRRPKTSRDG